MGLSPEGTEPTEPSGSTGMALPSPPRADVGPTTVVRQGGIAEFDQSLSPLLGAGAASELVRCVAVRIARVRSTALVSRRRRIERAWTRAIGSDGTARGGAGRGGERGVHGGEPEGVELTEQLASRAVEAWLHGEERRERRGLGRLVLIGQRQIADGDADGLQQVVGIGARGAAEHRTERVVDHGIKGAGERLDQTDDRPRLCPADRGLRDERLAQRGEPRAHLRGGEQHASVGAGPSGDRGQPVLQIQSGDAAGDVVALEFPDRLDELGDQPIDPAGHGERRCQLRDLGEHREVPDQRPVGLVHGDGRTSWHGG
jgi:hypothetical protein